MSQIVVSNLTFAYEGSYDNVFENVSFTLDTDWRLGLIGRNGRGKTTLLKLLMGELSYQGSISASVGFDYFPCPVENPEADAMQIIYDLCPECPDWRIYREIALLDMEGDILFRPFHTLSHGEQTRLLLAALFLKENRFLLLDEPTNHLDTVAKEIVERYLQGKKGFILVSHDRYLLDALADHILSINKAGIEVCQGNYSTWQYNKDLQDRFEAAKNEHLAKEVQRLSAAAQRTSVWSDKVERSKFHSDNSGIRTDRGYVGAKAAKMAKRSKVTEQRRQQALEEKATLLKNIEKAEPLKIFPAPTPHRRLVELRDFSLGYTEGHPLFQHLRLEIQVGDRVALTGKNGCGKSSLLKFLLGADLPHAGTCQLASGLTISAVPQDCGFLRGSLNDFARAEGVDANHLRSMLHRLDLPRVAFEKDLAALSEGQKKKVMLAKSLCQRAHLYLWDEPLNYIDILSRRQIEEMILDCRPTLLFAEHDRAFVDAVATSTVELAQYTGAYEGGAYGNPAH